MNKMKYFSFYSKNFEPEKQLSLEIWKEQRIKRLNKKFIDIEVSNIQILIESYKVATVIFDQKYKTYGYQDQLQKKLCFEKSFYGWLITKEKNLFNYSIKNIEQQINGTKVTKDNYINTSQPVKRYNLIQKNLYYQVRYGNTLSEISKIFNIKISSLIEWNKINNGQVKVGQKILLKNTLFIKKNYKTKKIEKLDEISKKYDISIKNIKFFNGLRQDTLKPNKELVLYIKPFIAYTVQPGDTLIELSNKYKIKTSTIKSINRLKRDYIYAGQEIIIPKEKKITL